MERIHKIEISSKTIIFTIVVILLLNVLWIVRDLLFSLFIAFMIMSVTKPFVYQMERLKIPRSISALLIFIVLFAVIGYGASFILPSLTEDMSRLFSNLNENYKELIKTLDPDVVKYLNGKSLTDRIPDVTSQVFPFIQNIFSNFIFLITTLFFSFYFIVEENFIKDFLKRFFKESEAERVARVFDKTEKRIGSWFRGQVILMTVIGVVTYIGLSLIGVRHPLSLAVIAGLLEAFPIVGPIIAAIPALIFAINDSYLIALYTLILYILIQQLENNLIVPTVMRRAIGLNKIIILMVILIGGKLAGVMGIFIAIPLTLCIDTILTEVVHGKAR